MQHWLTAQSRFGFSAIINLTAELRDMTYNYLSSMGWSSMANMWLKVHSICYI